MIHHFFAYIARLRYIRRWGLMRSSMSVNDVEHPLQVAMLAHGMALIGKNRYGRDCNPEHIVTLAVYHDASEVISGDMPTPVKYKNDALRTAYKAVEHESARVMASLQPAELQAETQAWLTGSVLNDAERKIVKAADRLSALSKCM